MFAFELWHRLRFNSHTCLHERFSVRFIFVFSLCVRFAVRIHFLPLFAASDQTTWVCGWRMFEKINKRKKMDFAFFHLIIISHSVWDRSVILRFEFTAFYGQIIDNIAQLRRDDRRMVVAVFHFTYVYRAFELFAFFSSLFLVLPFSFCCSFSAVFSSFVRCYPCARTPYT